MQTATKPNAEMVLRYNIEIYHYWLEVLQNNQLLKYYNDVIALLDKFSINQRLPIDGLVKPENTEQFIKCVCLYIHTWPFMGIEFSNGFTEVVRVETIKDIDKQIIRRQQ
jgi:hypothetical protein